MEESHVAKIYHIATGCVFNKNVPTLMGVDDDNQLRDPISSVCGLFNLVEGTLFRS